MRNETALLGTLGALGAAVMISVAPAAGADPSTPPPGPDPSPNAVAAAAPDTTPQAAPASTPTEGVPHLSSLDNLPPGTSAAPVVPEGRGVSYLRDLWHAVQTQEVSGGDALLLLTQRPMNADAAPPPGLPAGPQPAPQAAPPAAEPAPAPDPLP